MPKMQHFDNFSIFVYTVINADRRVKELANPRIPRHRRTNIRKFG